MVCPDDPLAEREAISAWNLKGKSLILPMRTNVRNELLSWFGDDLCEEQILFTSNLATNAALMVQAGLGYAYDDHTNNRKGGERREDIKKKITMLKKIRADLLEDLHGKQLVLDQVDYMIYELKKQI